MKHLTHKGLFLITAVAILLFVGVLTAQAQDRGTIRGAVYQDINGDGRCVNTGVTGEDPVPNIDIQFVSSDKKTIVTLYTGENGTYGLAAAGQSVWEVTARPNPAEWIVTSENPLYVPVVPESLEQTDVNFCVSKGANAVIILPQSGQAANSGIPLWLIITAVAGLAAIIIGSGLELRRYLTQ